MNHLFTSIDIIADINREKSVMYNVIILVKKNKFVINNVCNPYFIAIVFIFAYLQNSYFEFPLFPGFLCYMGILLALMHFTIFNSSPSSITFQCHLTSISDKFSFFFFFFFFSFFFLFFFLAISWFLLYFLVVHSCRNVKID